MEHFTRTRLLIGPESLDKLAKSRVVVFGVGVVGSFAIEALARAGVGCLVLVDYDTVCVTNINRQIEALHSTVGRFKGEVMKERIIDINPAAAVIIYQEFVTKDNVDKFIDTEASYIVDAVDNVSAKMAIIERGLNLNIPVISALGAGNRLDPTQLKVADISETSGCALARAVRVGLRKKGITHGVRVVYSRERPSKGFLPETDNDYRTIGSISFVPSVAGLFMAAQVVNDLIAVE